MSYKCILDRDFISMPHVMFMPDCDVGQLDRVDRPLQSLLSGHGGDGGDEDGDGDDDGGGGDDDGRGGDDDGHSGDDDGDGDINHD